LSYKTSDPTPIVHWTPRYFFSRANATGIILNNQKRYIYIDNQKQSQKLSYNLTLAVNQNWK